MTLTSERVRAFALRRKCCAIIITFDVVTSNMVMIYPIVNGIYIEYDDLHRYKRGFNMAKDLDWSERVKGMLKAELKRKNVGYRELAEKLGEIGIQETERNLANKISRGGFTAAFFIQCLEAIGCQQLRLD